MVCSCALSGNMAAEKRSNDARVTYLTEFELSQPPMLQHERLAAIKTTMAAASSVARNVHTHMTSTVGGEGAPKKSDKRKGGCIYTQCV